MAFLKRVVVLSCLLVGMMWVVACSQGAATPAGELEDQGPADPTEVLWTYEGETGPEAWGRLSEEYVLCGTGKEQSPIELSGAGSENLKDLVFTYQPSILTITNKVHTIEETYDGGSTLEVDGQSYELKRFHFHTPSEHTRDGQHSPLEMHLVHQQPGGALAVVGVMINEGGENAAFAPIWDKLPTDVNQAHSYPDISFNAADLLPTERLAFHYDGSLTTPPCSEDVQWLVLSSPIEMSAAQIEAFQKLVEFNSRPTQSLEGRTVELDAAAD